MTKYFVMNNDKCDQNISDRSNETHIEKVWCGNHTVTFQGCVGMVIFKLKVFGHLTQIFIQF